MSDPEYLICLNCENPAYDVEYQNGKLVYALCAACGNDELTEFMTESELEEQRG